MASLWPNDGQRSSGRTIISTRILKLDADMAIDAPEAGFASNHSLYDYDVVFWSPLRSLSLHYSERAYGSGKYEGLPRLSNDASARLKRDRNRRAAEFDHFLRLGRTLVIFVPSDLTVWVDSGKREKSGTGKNAQVTTIVEPFDILDVLPFRMTREHVTGTEMESVDSTIGPLYRQTRDFWSYASTIESGFELHPLLRVIGTDKVVSAQYLDESGGRVILLPFLHTGSDGDEEDPEDEEDDVLDDEDDPADVEQPTAPTGDEVRGDFLDDEAVDALVLEWVLSLTGGEEITWPTWIDEYQFQSEVQRSPQIAERTAAILDLQRELDVLNEAQEADRQWKLLVSGTGTPFEEAVATALIQLGFSLEPTVPGRTDLRGTQGAVPVVVETKGVSKSAAESHCAQLEKWVAEEVEAGRKPKGILVINAWLNEAPQSRTSAVFPSQMRPYAEMRNHCLVSGLQLLNIARTAIREPARRDELAAILLETTGVVDGWDDITEVFARMPEAPKRNRRASKT